MTDTVTHGVPVCQIRPQFYVHVAVHVADWDESIEPDDDEFRQIRSFGEYRCQDLREPYRSRTLNDPRGLVDSGINTITFRKHAAWGWGYGMASWTQGPSFFPVPGHGDKILPIPVDLADLLDHLGSRFSAEPIAPAWVAWKAAHPDIFGDPT